MAPQIFSQPQLSSGSIHAEDNSSSCVMAKPEEKILQDCEWLKEQLPESTLEERYRFYKARDDDEEAALAALKHYLEWKQQYQLTQEELRAEITQGQEHINNSKNNGDQADEYDWLVASGTAMNAHQTQKLSDNTLRKLPRFIRMSHSRMDNLQDVRDLEGKRILHLIPGQMDDSLCSLSTYALAIALYMDQRLARDSTEKITVLLDVRAGKGWPNIPAYKLVSFIKDSVQLLLALQPERLHKCIVYPVPFGLAWIFSAIKKVMDPVTAKKMCLLSGSPYADSPVPPEIKDYLDPDVALLLEENRIQSFVC